jgi:hypothetical protein
MTGIAWEPPAATGSGAFEHPDANTTSNPARDAAVQELFSKCTVHLLQLLADQVFNLTFPGADSYAYDSSCNPVTGLMIRGCSPMRKGCGKRSGNVERGYTPPRPSRRSGRG